MLFNYLTYILLRCSMLKKLFNLIFKDFYIFSCAYSNNIFPEPLEKDEEELYIKKFMSGDTEARNILIEHNLRLVAHIVKKYSSKNDSIDDLISIGTIGLIKGIDSYSNKKGIKACKSLLYLLGTEELLPYYL